VCIFNLIEEERDSERERDVMKSLHMIVKTWQVQNLMEDVDSLETPANLIQRQFAREL
jgi:hypothetical protein